jgi:hypothetical protein
MWLLFDSLPTAAKRMVTIRSIAAIPPGKTVWDKGKGAVAGFGARRQTGEAVAYVLKYRTVAGRQRWHTIGRHGAPWTPDLVVRVKRLRPSTLRQAIEMTHAVTDSSV